MFLIIWLGGIVYAVVHRRKHPTTSLLAGVALGILFVTGLLSSVLSAYIQHRYTIGELPVTQYVTMEDALSFVTFPLTVVGRLLLLAAVFWRKDAAGPEAPGNYPD